MTKNLLPVVSEDIGHAVREELLSQQGNDYAVEVIKRLAEENPCVAQFISNLILAASNRNEAMSALYVGVLVYRMLESQAEANYLNGLL